MNLSNNTVLITGGASGIGLALAERFLSAGSKVIICGRREDKLHEAKQKYPDLHTRVCDIADPAQRISLYQWINSNFPDVNVLINNAGIQKRVRLTEDKDPWNAFQQEVAINLEAPIHLSSLFIPHLQKHVQAYIINVSSGLAFVPGAFAPVYSATKAAIHSFTQSLRHQLSQTSIQVLEIIPPAVQTDLGGLGLHDFGVSLKDFTDAAITGLEAGISEIAYGFSAQALQASHREREELFRKLNSGA